MDPNRSGAQSDGSVVASTGPSPRGKKRRLSMHAAQEVYSHLESQQEEELKYLQQKLPVLELHAIAGYFHQQRHDLEMELLKKIQPLGDMDCLSMEDGGSVSHEERTEIVDFCKALLVDDKFDAICEEVMSSDRNVATDALTKFRMLFSIVEVFPTPFDRLSISPVVVQIFEKTLERESVLIPRFMSLLKQDVWPQCQIEACWILRNLAPGPRIAMTNSSYILHPMHMYCKKLLFSNGLLTILKEVLISERTDLVIQGILLTSSIARHNHEPRLLLLEEGVLDLLVRILQTQTNIGVLRKALDAMSILFRANFAASDAFVTFVSFLNRSEDEMILSNVCNGISAVLPKYVEPFFAEKVIMIAFQHTNSSMKVKALQTAHDIVSRGGAVLSEALLRAFFSFEAEQIILLLRSAPEVQQEFCRLLVMISSNRVCIGSLLAIQGIIVELSCLLSDNFSLRSSIVAIFHNLTNGSPDQLSLLMSLSVPLVDSLSSLLLLYKSVDDEGSASFRIVLVREVLGSLLNILSLTDSQSSHRGVFSALGAFAKGFNSPRSVLVPRFASLFDDRVINRLIHLCFALQCETRDESETYKTEFLCKLEKIFRAVRSAMDSSEKSVRMEQLDSVIRWFFAVDDGMLSRDGSEPTSENEGEGAADHGLMETEVEFIQVKFIFHREIVLHRVPRKIKFAALMKAVAERFPTAGPVAAQYRDDDGDFITVGNQDDLNYCVQRYLAGAQKALRLYLTESSRGFVAPKDDVEKERPKRSPRSVFLHRNASRTLYSSDELAKMYDQWIHAVEDGYVSKERFAIGMQMMGLNVSELMMDQCFRAFDLDGDGKCSLDEVIKGLGVVQRGSRDEKLSLAFRAYDLKRTGFISADDLFTIFKAANEAGSGEKLDDEMIRSMTDQCFEEIDVNRDGQLQFLEFKAAVDMKQIKDVFFL